MAEISRFRGIVIKLHFTDHPPPHFHAHYGSSRASFTIATGEVLAGSLPPRVRRLVLEWAEQHRGELAANWHRAEQRRALTRIAPLE